MTTRARPTVRRVESRSLLEQVWVMRDNALRYLQKHSIDCPRKNPRYVLELLERALGISPITQSRKIRPVFARYLVAIDKISQGARLEIPEPLPVKRVTAKAREEAIRAFYVSYEWRKLRYETILRYNRICMCCRRPDIPIHVDHIKSLRRYWHLRLDPENLQVLCEDCNHGKGNGDETDFRPAMR